MKAFVISYMCYNTRTAIMKHGPMIKTANSSYEAEGMVLAELRASFTVQDGWANYDAAAMELTVEQMVILLAKMTE